MCQTKNHWSSQQMRILINKDQTFSSICLMLEIKLLINLKFRQMIKNFSQLIIYLWLQEEAQEKSQLRLLNWSALDGTAYSALWWSRWDEREWMKSKPWSGWSLEFGIIVKSGVCINWMKSGVWIKFWSLLNEWMNGREGNIVWISWIYERKYPLLRGLPYEHASSIQHNNNSRIS